ncbi:MAG: heavy metal translocating P-type ATPase [Kofleriaceae bacterium]
MKTKDPVCGMTVTVGKARGGTATHDGHEYWFCNPKCRDKFIADPAKYLQPQAPTQPPAPPTTEQTRAIYTCPMHPEVRQRGPGSCPKCGMALEPDEPIADAGPDPELIDMTRRLWISAVLTLPILVVAMGEMFGLPRIGGASRSWIELALATPVVAWGGWPVFARGWASLTHRSLNMFTLIAIGTGAAFGFSVVATLWPAIVPIGMRAHDGAVPLYFEAAAVIVTLVLLGQVLELRARHATAGALRALLALAPKTARRVDADADHDIPIEYVQIGDRLRVRPGERVPVDGIVVDGHTSIDESMVTGESLPVEKHPGAKVTAGTLNATGAVVIRAERVGRDTLLAQIVRMVAEAQRTRAPIQRLADRVASWFVPAVLVVAVTTAIGWSLFGPEPRLAYALVNAIAVLIIACPCALGLATPMSIMVATGRGAHAGVLIRRAEALEALETIDTLVVDKTGTVTEGKPRVVAITTSDGTTEAQALTIAAALERNSEHPLASAVLEAARARELVIPAVTEFKSMTGSGVRGTIAGSPALVGNAALLSAHGIALDALESAANAQRAEGQTVMYVALAGRTIAAIGIADPIKSTANATIRALRDRGIGIVMLTGDNRVTADAVARALEIDRVIAEVLPDHKQAEIERLQRDGNRVAMAGDGINDAPALARADVGIAMGTGTDVAIQSAGITLVKGDLRGVVRAHQLSRYTMRNIRQNLWFAFAYNAVGIPIAAGVLYPIFGVLLSPMIASAAMSISSVSVIANALRLRSARLDE